MTTIRAHISTIITGLLLTGFLLAMSPGIGRAVSQIQGSIQSIQAHAGSNGGGEL